LKNKIAKESERRAWEEGKYEEVVGKDMVKDI
jgi:hypothetical protein